MDEVEKQYASKEALLGMATDIVSAYVSKNVLASEEISDLINAVYTAAAGVQSNAVVRLANAQKPSINAIDINKCNKCNHFKHLEFSECFNLLN